MKGKAYCAHLSIHDRWAHEQMSRSGGQYEEKSPMFRPQESLVLIYRPTEEMTGIMTFLIMRIESRNCGVEARYATTWSLWAFY
ncbi:hypothetical protein TNCV_2707621 [Trichonephila clavipes]|nr:hypothetical protein TNCV_2707621 [Trichonephila clavipes]